MKQRKINARFSELLTGIRKDKKQIKKTIVKKQINASLTAWQTLHNNDFKYIRGVMLADEVGGGKTYEALSIISKYYLEKNTINNTGRGLPVKNNKRFRVLILADSSIQTKWLWNEDCLDNNGKLTNPEKCDFSRFIFQTKFKQFNDVKKDLLLAFFKKQKKCKRNTFTEWKKSGSSNDNNGTWVSSFNLLPKVLKKKGQFNFPIAFPRDAFDIIIIDEAHTAKSGSANIGDVKSELNKTTYQKVQALFNSNPDAKVLLLTATPFQNGITDLKSMLDLLEKETPTKEDSIIHKIKLKLDDANKILNDQLNSLKENKEVLDFKGIKAVLNNSANEGLNHLLRHLVIRNNKKPIDVKPVEINLKPLEELQYYLLRSLVPVTKDDNKEMYATKLSQLVSSDEAFSKRFKLDKRTNEKNINKGQKLNQIKQIFNNKNLVIYRKMQETLNKLIEIEHEIKSDSKRKKVIIIFFRFINSISEFESFIKKSTDSNKFPIDIITGSWPHKINEDNVHVTPIERFKLLEKLNTTPYSEVKLLLISQVGNEGLDFDGFSDTIIHYDGHYNPAVIDQRNGRIYRGANIDNPKKLNIYQVFLQYTYDAHIKHIMEEKKKLKDFFLGTTAFDKIIDTDEANNHEINIINQAKRITIDLTPQKKYILKKYQNEVSN